MSINRGEIWMVDFGQQSGEDDHLQHGLRPVVIVSNDTANRHSPVVHCVPLTSRVRKKSKGFSYYYGLAKRFYDQYGHTDFPDGELTVGGEILPESGETLAVWKREQESGDVSEKKGGRAKEKLKMLHEIGICAEHGLPLWEKKYRAAEAYYREHGDLLVPFSYITEDGIQLGKWISNQRIKRRGTWGTPPTEEQIRRLDAIGMSWDESENRGKRKKPAKRYS